MKSRRFVGKRRRKARRVMDDLMAARHVGAHDRLQIARFERYLRNELSTSERAAYEDGSEGLEPVAIDALLELHR